jgi:DNA repair photolyase
VHGCTYCYAVRAPAAAVAKRAAHVAIADRL